jgi:S1 RNA binding domain protein
MEHYVGMVSPNAKEKVQELIQNHGMFKFSMAISQTVPQFENDLGLLLVKEVEKKIKDCL